ncbi:MAG: restriction endonuclease [Chloroflexi bacterium]|nr:restriction endonuclease [Chloroflexota bacterium]
MMESIAEFHIGEHYTNDQIRFSLGLGNLGGIRPSIDSNKRLRHLTIITSAPGTKLRAENPYHDRIEGDVLIFTAQGREGDQALSGTNKRLLEQYSDPVPFYGFINEGRQYYRFLGLLELLRHYQEVQADRRKKLRKVWLFELRIHTQPDIVPINSATVITASILGDSRRANPLYLMEREVSYLPDTLGQDMIEAFPSTEAESVRSSMLRLPPFKFEYLIKDLMEHNGFSTVRVTSATGDGGIDINAYVDEANDFFAGTHVQAQVKRWRHAVGSAEINKFRGALSSTAKGVFVTTSHYTKAAILEARHESKPCVTLIDGIRLASMVLKSNLDVESVN